MKKLFLFFLVFLFISHPYFFSQTITSTTTGGLWDYTGTWVGGVIPGQNNDVIIDGTVTVNQTCNIRNLTINSGKILQPNNYYGTYTINITGNITNNGTIRLNPSGNNFDILVTGNVQNNGYWETRTLAFGGQNTQFISNSAGKFLITSMRKRNWGDITYSTNKIIAASDIILKGDFELNGVVNNVWTGGILDMAGYSLTLASSASVLNGMVQNVPHLFVIENSRLENIEFSGDMTLHGTGRIYNSEVYFNGTITIADTLQPYPYYSPRVNFRGNIINNGIIRAHKDGQTLDLAAWGNVHNNGIWQTRIAYFPGKNTQMISQSPGMFFQGEIRKRDMSNFTYTSGGLVAASDLTFNNDVDLQGVIIDTWGWGSIDMAGFSLYLQANGNIYYGTVKNVPHIYMMENSRLESVNFNGDVVLHNRVRIYNSEVVFNGNVTITDTLFPYPYYSPRLTIKGNVTNNGIIRKHADGQFIDLRIYGNISNNGIWQPRITYLPSTSNQTLSQAPGKFFEGELYKREIDDMGNSTGQIIAGSDLTFKGVFYLNSAIDNVWGNYGIVDMKGKNLTFSGDGSVFYGTIKNAANLYVIENSWLQDVIFDGDMTLRGRGRVYNSEVYFNGTLTIADTLQAYPYYSPRVNFNGNLINNGTIKWNPGGQYLDLRTFGNITNNGTWEPRITFLAGSKDQTIFQAAGKFFKGEFRKRDFDDKGFDSKVIAGSNLVFNDVKAFYLNSSVNNVWKRGILDMNGKSLTLANEAYLNEGIIQNVSDLIMLDKATISSVSFNGELNIKGNGLIYNDDVVFNDNVTIIDSLQAYPYYSPSPSFMKNLTNFGVIKDNKLGQELNPKVYGNLYNYGTWNCRRTYWKSPNKNDTLYGQYNTYMILSQTETSGTGDFYTYGSASNLGTFEIQGSAKLINSKGFEFVNSGTISGSGSVKNYGKFASTHKLDYYDPLNPGLSLTINLYDRKNLEKVTVTYFANSAPKSMTSAMKQWWRIVPKGEVGGYGLVFIYDVSMLNGNNENDLEVYCSPDSSKTWKKLSTPLNLTRNLTDKTLTIGNSNNQLINQFGDIVIASGKPVSIPNISTAIGGRRQIRVGPPNIYTISYWNNSTAPTDNFVMHFTTNRGVHIKSVISKSIETGQLIEMPIDSLNYDGERNDLFLLIQGMAAKEVRSFDIILTAEPGYNAINKSTLEPITFTVVALWIGGAILEEYVSEVMVQDCYEMWAPVRNNQTLTDAGTQALKNSMRKAATVENGVQGIAKKGAKEIVEATGRAVVWPAYLAHDIYKCMKNAFNGMKDYVNGNFDRQDKPLDKVTSWDPNAKEGPTGYGSNGYMATSAPMAYTIFFENKKEATAPAWKIIVVDTLDDKVFDVNSVQFGNMSHSMGVAARNGNVLTWTFENIELPPNVTPPQGEGWVKFIVNPKSNLPTGTQMKNKAVIIFDLNKPLATNVSVNTLDFDPPKTNITSVSNVQGSRNVKVAWTIDDGVGAGAKNSMIFMASNDGPFSLVKTTDSSQAVIPVVGNVNYKFYVLSQDNVGNSELTPAKIIDILTDVKTEEVIPVEFSLFQNYPNPFNPVTTISYSVPFISNVRIVVYNILGQTIKELVNDVKSAGNFKVQFDGSKLASGVYFYSLDAKALDNINNFRSVKKLILLK